MQLLIVFLTGILLEGTVVTQSSSPVRASRQAYLEQLYGMIRQERPSRGSVSPLDTTWADWLKRTGELPPDFDAMPSIPFLPDPLVLDEGGANIPIKTMAQWKKKRAWIMREIQHWLTGTFPPPPKNMVVKTLEERKEGEVTVRLVELRFGPQHRATLTVELLIPPGEGPFPVFATQWNHRPWALIALRRGYIGCVYAAADIKDDTEAFWRLYYPRYDFTRLMRRAWGCSRVIDYLYTLPIVDRRKIGLTGHSRNGKQSLMAAAFDERITAVVPTSGGSQPPWRYTSDNHDSESIEDLTSIFPHWLHPRLRFFIGKEHKLPIDQNLLMALVAPRGLMITTAVSEPQGNPWAVEQLYRSVKRVYGFLGAENKLTIRLRNGRHTIQARDVEDYVDFFDYVFGRSSFKPSRRLLFEYSFEEWQELSGERIDPLKYPETGYEWCDAGGETINNAREWEVVKPDVLERIKWGLGKEPAIVFNQGPRSLADHRRRGDDYIGKTISRPEADRRMGRMVMGPYHSSPLGAYQYANLYYPTDAKGQLRGDNLPAVIFLHEYDYANGFARESRPLFKRLTEKGVAVLAFDFVGFGTRIMEGTRFYQRHPHWSKLGNMVADTRAAVDILHGMEFIDGDRIYVLGYSLGGTVGLYAAALDDRIAGAAALCGVQPMRTATADKGIEGLRAFSHLHGLQPRLGFFVGQEARVPYDWHEILGCIAPRPLLVIAPQWDKDAPLENVTACIDAARKIYSLYGAEEQFEYRTPMDFDRFPQKRQQELGDWIGAAAAQ